MQKQDDGLFVYVFFGLIGSGKSTLALAWSKRLAVGCYNSDVVRKELAGRTSSSGRDIPFNQDMYSEVFTRQTYNALIDKAAKDLSLGRSVILDASYRCRADRESVRNLAKKHGAQTRFILCFCPEAVLQQRMEVRARDPKAVSDGRWEIYQKQKEIFEEPRELPAGELITLSTQAPVSLLVERLAHTLGMNSEC